jgi:hypothetical protein
MVNPKSLTLYITYGFWLPPLGVKPLIHQSGIRTYNTKVVPFQEKSSFHVGVLWKLLNGMD